MCNTLFVSMPLVLKYALTAITAAVVVPCGGSKMSPRTLPIGLIIGHLRSVKIFRVFKPLTFRNILLSNVQII